MNVYTFVSIMAIVTLLVLILYNVYRIFKLVFYKKIEDFQMFSKSDCDFDVRGSELQLENSLDCINKCMRHEDPRKLYKHCTYKKCSDKCNECEQLKYNDKTASCPWDSLAYYQTDKYNSNILVAPRINVVTFNGYIKVSFVKPNKNVSGYIYFLTKSNQSNQRNDGVVLGKFPNSECILCEKIIKDLDEKTMYSIGVKSYNRLDNTVDPTYSPMSNIVNFIPKVKMTYRAYDITTPIERMDDISVENICNN